MKIKYKPLHIFAEIKRIDEEARTFDAYAFVNEVVEGEGGLRLKRTAMESATPDYMEWANVRRMHQADAVGVAENVVWDEKGAMLTVSVHDDDAWNKVKNRVYKGLSVGVAAVTMRGKDVESCRWYETSLVDRPKDPDAKILAFRAEGIEPGEQEFEAEVEEIRRSFADMVPDLEMRDQYDDFSAAFYTFVNACYEDPDTAAQSVDEFAAYLKGILGEGSTESRAAGFETAIARMKAPTVDIARVSTLESENTTVLERAQTAEAELARVQGALTERSAALATAEERVKTLERMPVPERRGPVRYPAALERTFAANEAAGVDPEQIQALQTELAALQEKLPKEPDEKKRSAGVTQLMTVQRQLRELGVDA